MNEDSLDQPKSKEALIRENLRRAFAERASEEIPTDLMALVAKLRAQDDKNGTS